MKTITYNPETHVLVPREPTQAMCSAALAFDNNKPLDEWGMIVSNTYEETYSAMLAAAPQPEPNHNWCAGCSPDNCSGCGAEPVESEPVPDFRGYAALGTGQYLLNACTQNRAHAATRLVERGVLVEDRKCSFPWHSYKIIGEQ